MTKILKIFSYFFISLFFFFFANLIVKNNSYATSQKIENFQQLNTGLESQKIWIISQQCAHGGEASQYWKVTTQQGEPLEIRSSPDGKVIGAIPNDWYSSIIRRDATGRWAELAGFPRGRGSISLQGPAGYRSAPLYRQGWVMSSSLKGVGQLCEKPSHRETISYLKISQPNLVVKIHEDWLQLGDRIAQAQFQLETRIDSQDV